MKLIPDSSKTGEIEVFFVSIRFYLGIDVSKKSLAVALIDPRGNKILWKNKDIPNKPKGFKKIIEKAEEAAARASGTESFEIAVGAEATGVYGEKLCCHLHEGDAERGHFVTYILNPRAVRSFADASMEINKNDATDALQIASYLQIAIEKGLVSPWLPPSPEVERLRALCHRRDELVKFKSQELDRQEKLEYMAHPTSDVAENVAEHIAYLQKAIDALEDEIRDLINKTPKLKEDNALLQSIPGVGEILAAMFQGEIGDRSRFATPKQVVAFFGMAPRECSSGTSVYKRPKITKRGGSHLRRCLYMAAMSAIQHNQIVRGLYERLLERGKAKMTALIACMRKMLHLMWGVLKTRVEFTPGYVSDATV